MTSTSSGFGSDQVSSYYADMRLDRFSVDVTTRIRIEIVRTLDCWSPHDPFRMPDAVADINESRISNC